MPLIYKVRNAKMEYLANQNWNDPEYVLKNYKTEQCTIKFDNATNYCQLGWICPCYHSYIDKRRKNENYKSARGAIPCRYVFDEETRTWADETHCPNGEQCGFAHFRNEIQYNKSRYKVKACIDWAYDKRCIRDRFCAFIHDEPNHLETLKQAQGLRAQIRCPIENIIPFGTQSYAYVTSVDSSMTRWATGQRDLFLYPKGARAQPSTSTAEQEVRSCETIWENELKIQDETNLAGPYRLSILLSGNCDTDSLSAFGNLGVINKDGVIQAILCEVEEDMSPRFSYPNHHTEFTVQSIFNESKLPNWPTTHRSELGAQTDWIGVRNFDHNPAARSIRQGLNEVGVRGNAYGNISEAWRRSYPENR